MITEAKLTVAGPRARAVNVGLERPVQSSSGEIPTAPLVLIDLETREGTTGHVRIAQEASTPIGIGENWWGPHDVQKSLEAEACDYGMLDAMKIGSVTGRLRTAALTEPAGLPLVSHIFPEISAHLLAASPTTHRLEYLDLAGPILREPLKVEDGQALVPSGPGIGLEWDAVGRFLVG